MPTENRALHELFSVASVAGYGQAVLSVDVTCGFVLWHFPNDNIIVVTSAHNSRPASAESRASDIIPVSNKNIQSLAAHGVPDSDCIIKAAADDAFSIATECHASDPTSVSQERAQSLTSRCIPQLQQTVAMPTDDSRSVGADRHGHRSEILYHLPDASAATRNPMVSSG